MNRIISSSDLMKILDVNQQQLAGLREKGLKGMRIGHGKWVFLVEDVIDFLKARIEQGSSRV